MNKETSENYLQSVLLWSTKRLPGFRNLSYAERRSKLNL